MTAPATTARLDPSGIKLPDGYRTLIAFGGGVGTDNADVSFWEKTVTPPGLDALDPIDQTTMHNDRWRTFAGRALITMTGASLTVAYDPAVIPQIVSDLLGVETPITVHFPDGKTLSFWGFLQTFEPQAHEEGTQPEANITIGVTNMDPDNGTEEGPVLKTAAGTVIP
jgi:hypothetical protein